MNTNQVVADAVAQLNTERTKQVQTEAVRLISCISNEQSKIADANKRIVELREKAVALANDVVDETTVLGSPLPDNANRETIAAVIAKANKDRQYTVEQSATRLTLAITAEQDAIALIEKRITELRAALVKLTVPVVTVEQVVGN